MLGKPFLFLRRKVRTGYGIFTVILQIHPFIVVPIRTMNLHHGFIQIPQKVRSIFIYPIIKGQITDPSYHHPVIGITAGDIGRNCPIDDPIIHISLPLITGIIFHNLAVNTLAFEPFSKHRDLDGTTSHTDTHAIQGGDIIHIDPGIIFADEKVVILPSLFFCSIIEFHGSLRCIRQIAHDIDFTTR